MSSGTLFPLPRFIALDSAGVTLPGAKLYFYSAGTSTALDTYSDVGLTTPNANPCVASAGGLFGAIYLNPATSYKCTLNTSAGVLVYSQDNLVPTAAGTSGVTDIAIVAGENLAANDAVYLSDGSGGNVAGRWYRTSSANAYSSTLPLVGAATAAVTAAASGTARVSGALAGYAGLTVGGTYYLASAAGTISTTAPAYARILGFADTTTDLLIAPAGSAQGGGTVDVNGTAGETLAAGNCCYLSDGSGAKTAGRWYLATNANGYSSTLPEIGFATAAITAGSTGLIRQGGTITGLSGLTAGTRYFITAAGALTATAPALARSVGQADTTTSLVVVADDRQRGMVLLTSGSGTDTSAGATNVATFAMASGLGANDTLLIYVTIAAVTQAVATPLLYNSTDAVSMGSFANLAAGQAEIAASYFKQAQHSSTTVYGNVGAAVSVANTQIPAFVTAWTGGWTLALRHGGVTGGGTFEWSWAVYVLRG